MAVTATNALSPPYRVEGNRKKTVYNVKFDSSYLAEGETLDKTSVGLANTFDHAICTIKKPAKTVNVAQAFYDGSKIKLFDETPAEVASEADVEGLEVQVVSWGV